ncbi:glycogen debranching N-terminal domain-containing protein [Microbacterium sp. zg-Y818]|uniref:glycogen debranching N-terminal domain-containing protein n=1 Tax=unclassified Microbacterium TaxID=2609290 RepID=UPI00214C7436|nr:MULTISPECIES: glycogen debranching N-terminal domain-containing protein [unclassified Microbacterium]MCR2799406.1 amylo-alpha-1,6-glucosidase [Microbacterium sp. zg.Y818]WIM21405.1 glycogen debranching N-terminal domain-containing protein [Microbacterium sp. zg-Y818]
MSAGWQPFLSDRVVALRAPTQVWSGRDGDAGGTAIEGIYHGDTRFLRHVRLEYRAPEGKWQPPEPISVMSRDAATVIFGSLLRGVDDATPDPKVRLERLREVRSGVVTETLRLHSHLNRPLVVLLRVRLTPDFSPLQEVKSGAAPRTDWSATGAGSTVQVRRGQTCIDLVAPTATTTVDEPGNEVTLVWQVRCEPRSSTEVTWRAQLVDPALVVLPAGRPVPWSVELPEQIDPRLRMWVHYALSDLDALRLALPIAPHDEFFAAGAPWFFTLFGRDSLWTARMLLPVDTTMAASTLRVLARLQGTKDDPESAEQPGKIAHELRAVEFAMPGEGIVLPPLYYGTVDATPLWVCLLVDAASAGMPEDDVRQLLPNLRAALEWIDHAAADGFVEYLDETDHGLSNQGWKDSGDSIQWRDGTLAAGPIALCEVQGYAYEAAAGAAALLDSLGEPGGERLRAWAESLRDRFRDRFWVQTPEGRYPAIALDRDGRGVDTLTSNIGHLLGTGILSPAEEAEVSALLVGPTMSSGFGVRTMSTAAAGYWPLSYHGGSVWAHDSAIIARGMARAGREEDARVVVEGLLAAAEAFEFRMPELHAGDAATTAPAPAPYPAACRPQAWSAAAAIVCLQIATRR